jgi:hypothetical protein
MIIFEKTSDFVEAVEACGSMYFHGFRPITTGLVEAWKQITNITCVRRHVLRTHAHMHKESEICLHASTN